MANLNIFNVDSDPAGRQMVWEHCIDELCEAAKTLSKDKTGTLVVIERKTRLGEQIDTGVLLNATVSEELLLNIFFKNTPLHDGAVVIRGNRVVAATCYLPLSDNTSISKDLGTRHRAAVGVSEVTDSLTIVVSEETGRISLAENGRLTRIVDADTLSRALSRDAASEEQGNRFRIWKGRLKNERKADK